MTSAQREPSYEFRNLANGLHEYFTSLTLAGFADDQALSLTHMLALTQIMMNGSDEEDEEEGGEDPLGPWRQA